MWTPGQIGADRHGTLSVNEAFARTLQIYGVPSEALWRALELCQLLRLKENIGFASPILEIGCGDGAFSSLLFTRIDDAIDINQRALERCRKTAAIYDAIHCVDARSMPFSSNRYKTVYANCVIEHIPELSKVLSQIHRVLDHGGKFVATVPLRDMNQYLLFRRDWYASLRQKQLNHVNLLSQSEWKAAFAAAGFDWIEVYPYLPGSLCRYWDIMDSIFCLGAGRYNLGSVFRKMTLALPVAPRRVLGGLIARVLAPRISKSGAAGASAIVLLGYKG